MSVFRLSQLILSLTLPGVLVFCCPLTEAQSKGSEPGSAGLPPAPNSKQIRAINLPKESNDLISKGGVFIFFDPVCPICAEYFPTIENLHAKYSQSQPFFLVMKPEDAALANDFIDKYHPHPEILIDQNGELQTGLNARVTPHAFLVKSGKTIYSGRIDDRYESIGHRRSVIRTNDLEDALKASQQGASTVRQATQPVGCFLEPNKRTRSKQGT